MADRAGWPRIVVVTDRRRLVRRIGAEPDAWPELLQAQIAGALAGGADLVQVREPDLEGGRLARFLRRTFEHLPAAAGRVVVNDRVDVAWVTGAAGVHLAERSVTVDEARALLPPGKAWVIGRSVHEQRSAAAASRAADYLLAGTVQASASKAPAWRLLGWEGLAEVVRAAGGTPVVAIGGLGADQVDAVLQAGAVGLAGIGCFLPEPGDTVEVSVQARVGALRKAFDKVGGEP
jgi:thiamine-phosphate pyrophosphorylase